VRQASQLKFDAIGAAIGGNAGTQRSKTSRPGPMPPVRPAQMPDRLPPTKTESEPAPETAGALVLPDYATAAVRSPLVEDQPHGTLPRRNGTTHRVEPTSRSAVRE
jgi:hypothetical protein